MKSISIKFDEKTLRNIDESIEKNNYVSRTDFIREAIRFKISHLKRQSLINQFLSLRGKSNRRTSLKEDKVLKEIASQNLLEELNEKFS